MAGGVVVSAGGRADYPGKLTGYVIITCIIAATGGLIFGYDIGISGGVTNMSPFLKKFFRNVYRRKEHNTTTNQYCTFDSVVLTLFTSSLYLAALVASLFASWATWKFGRKISMLFGGAVFLAGAAINGAAMNVEMLIIGRILLGIGVGFANQSVPVYLSEMAPARYRGALNMCFQLMITIGILAANVINYGTNKIRGGWRYSLGGAGIPALIISLGSLFLPDTPNYIIDRFPAEKEKARSLLRKIRGTDDIEEEYKDLVAASVASQSVGNPWQNILKRKYRPQLVMSIAIPFFQQFTGINVIMFYAPVLFTSIGFGDNASLISAVITGSVNVFATLVSIYFVDKLGRRFLFLQGGFQMFLFQIAVGTLIAIKFGTSGVADISKGYANGVVACICIYVAGFAWSWGPLGWLVPSEIFPLEIRSAGQSINVCVNMFFTFLIAQVFLAMLCHMKFGLFYFFAGWVFIMTIFIKLFLPETKNVPIEEMFTVWESHWFWKKYAADNEDTAAGDQELKKIPV